MPINSFPPVILMYSLYHFSSQRGYHLVTFKLRSLTLRCAGQNLSNLGYYPITNRLRHIALVTIIRHSTRVIRHLPESTTCVRIASYRAASK